MASNEKEKDNVCYAQPKNLAQRVAIANDFVTRFKYPVPFAIDDMNNAANDIFAAWPERLYIVDENGNVTYKGGNGPFNYKPAEVRAWLAQRYGEVKHPDAPAPAKPGDSTTAPPKTDSPQPDQPKPDQPKPDQTEPGASKPNGPHPAS